jgi:hypothetical protein
VDGPWTILGRRLDGRADRRTGRLAGADLNRLLLVHRQEMIPEQQA